MTDTVFKSHLKTIRIYIWADDRLWTVDFEKIVVNTGEDDCHIYDARAEAGPENGKTTIWSMSRLSKRAHDVDQSGALAWYCRHLRKNAAAILSNKKHHIFLDDDAIDEYFPPKSGKPADLVQREIDDLLFEVSSRVATGTQGRPLPMPTAWPVHGRFLQDVVPQAYPALRSFYDMYFKVTKRGLIATDGQMLWSGGVHSLWLLEKEQSNPTPAAGVSAGSDAGPRQSSQPPDRFEQIEQIGGGRYGDVWKCRDIQLQRDVAVKYLRPTQGLSTALDHARALARAQHPNIVTVHQIEVLPFPGDEFPGITADAIVMELLKGDPLDERLKGPPFSLEEVLSIATQIINAVEHIHLQGLAHGDLHSGNIMINEAKVKVIDILYLTGETLALIGTSSVDQRLRRDLLGIARLVSDIVCLSTVRDCAQEGLRQALASVATVAEQRAILENFLENLEETSDEGKSEEASSPLADQTRDLPSTDLLVLKAIAEIALTTGLSLIDVEDVAEHLAGSVEGDALQEALEALDEDIYVEATRLFDGIGHVTLTLFGFETYADHFWPKYDSIVNEVAQLAGAEELNSSIAMAQHMDVPQLGVDFALADLEGRGLLRTTREGSGNLFVHNVSVKLRRMVKGKASTAEEVSPVSSSSSFPKNGDSEPE